MTVRLPLNDNGAGLKKEIPAHLNRQGFLSLKSGVVSPESGV